MESRRPDGVTSTYLALRLSMVLLVLLLLLAVAIQLTFTGTPGCFQPSFSAYYYTPVRPVFIAALSGIGLGLIVYRGNTDLENVILNFSGFLAVIVAFVPTQIGTKPCDTTNRPTPDEIARASVNNVSALFLAGFVAVVIAAIVALRRPRADVSPPARVAAVVTPIALIAGAIVFVAAPGLFQNYGHATAAIALFVGIMVVVAINAIDGRPPYRVLYGSIAVGMPVSAVIAYFAGQSYWVFWVEFVLIVEFAIFWAVQTWELRNQPVRAGETVTRGIGHRTTIRTWPETD